MAYRQIRALSILFVVSGIKSGRRAANHNAASDAAANVAIERIILGSRMPPNQAPRAAGAIAIAAIRAASRSTNARRFSRTPPRQTRLARMKAKYARFSQPLRFGSSARKWLLAIMMAVNCANAYRLTARLPR